MRYAQRFFKCVRPGHQANPDDGVHGIQVQTEIPWFVPELVENSSCGPSVTTGTRRSLNFQRGSAGTQVQFTDEANDQHYEDPATTISDVGLPNAGKYHSNK